MQKTRSRILSLALSFTTSALLALGGGLSAQAAQDSGQQPPEQSQSTEQSPGASQTPPARPTLPYVTGTVLRWTGSRIDLKTADGKTQKVAVNTDTKQMVEIERGAEVSVEYRRKVGDFLIAERVVPAKPARQEEASGKKNALGTVTGSVVSRSNNALVLKTEAGDVTLFLSPWTEYKVESLQAGQQVTVEYRDRAEQGRFATSVRDAGKESGKKSSPKPEGPAEG